MPSLLASRVRFGGFAGRASASDAGDGRNSQGTSPRTMMANAARSQSATPRTNDMEAPPHQTGLPYASSGLFRSEEMRPTASGMLRSEETMYSQTSARSMPTRSLSKTRKMTWTEQFFAREKPPEYVLLPGGQAVKQWDDPLECSSCPVIDPQVSPYAEKWDMVMTSAVLLTALWTPYEVAFVSVSQMRFGFIFVFDRLLDLVFLKDMVLQFMMSYPEEREGTTRWVRDRGKIVMHYLSGWFWVDSFALLPLDLLVEGTCFRSKESLRDLKVVRLVRLFRLMKVGRIIKKWQVALGVSYGKVALMKFAFLTVMAVHWMSCMWGLLALQKQGIDDDSSRTWLRGLFRTKEFTEEEIEFYTEPHHVYLLSLYWAVMTLTSLGYGDIVAENMHEYMFCVFCFVASGLIWAYVIGSICGIISAMDPLLLQYQQNMDLLNIMMQDNNLPEEMRRRLRLYFQESRNLQRKLNQQTVVATLSPGLQGELAMKITHEWIQRVWYLHVLDAEPVIEISKRLKPMIFASQEPLALNNGSRTLFIVARGVVARGGLILGKNCVVGDDMIISNPVLRSQARPICVTFIEVIYFRNEQLDEVREAFPYAELRIRKAQVRWALRRGFVLAAWHRVRWDNYCGPRTTDYFKREIPSFTTPETVEAWSELATPRGSLGEPKKRASVRGRSTLLSRKSSLAALGAVSTPMLGGLMPPLPDPQLLGARPGTPGGHLSAVLAMLEQMRQEFHDGVSRLETRLERVERRVNPGFLS